MTPAVIVSSRPAPSRGVGRLTTAFIDDGDDETLDKVHTMLEQLPTPRGEGSNSDVIQLSCWNKILPRSK